MEPLIVKGSKEAIEKMKNELLKEQGIDIQINEIIKKDKILKERYIN